MPIRPFVTERTRRFRQSELSELNKQEISNIEEFGCQVLHISADSISLGFSYTFGIYDTCSRPDVIVIGLSNSTAHFLLNEAAMRLRRGVDLSQNRQKGMIGDVDCQFRHVDTKWVQQLMHGANWYYQDTNYPVLQAVYPDMNNLFPEEAGFDSNFVQPLLQSEAPFLSLGERVLGLE